MLIYVQKVINGRTNQNYSAEPHKKWKVKKCLHIRVALKLT